MNSTYYVCLLHTLTNILLDLLQQSPDAIDLVVTDIKMPRMDGIQLIRNIRRQSLSHKIIVLTGVIDSDELNQAQQLDLFALHNKPLVDPTLLFEDIERALALPENAAT